MINCIIIDDEQPARDSLSLMLNRFFSEKISVVTTAESLKEGVLAIYKFKPDLVFLDIEMQDEDGFKIFEYFQKIDFSIIFTTAYKEYAIKAIKVAALDYILKPIGIEDLRSAIELYEKHQLEEIKNENIERLVDALNSTSTSIETKVILPTFNGFKLEKINSIIYCEADQNYTKVFTIDGSNILVSRPLNKIEENLPSNVFFRIHKSYIVNLNYIKEFSREDGYHVILDNGVKLVVAIRRKDEFISIISRGSR